MPRNGLDKEELIMEKLGTLELSMSHIHVFSPLVLNILRSYCLLRY